MDGDRRSCCHVRQGAAVVPAVLLIRVRYVEPGYSTAGAHVRLHAGTESRGFVTEREQEIQRCCSCPLHGEQILATLESVEGDGERFRSESLAKVRLLC